MSAAFREGRERFAHVAAQAKINLFLRVGAREPDGYHRIETLFHRIDLADEIRVGVEVPQRTLSCTGPALPASGLGPAAANLAYRAAETYADLTGWPETFAIHLTKRIPVGGGLGGGSADAGAVLRALDTLSPKPVGDVELRAMATLLGADVAFLASDSVAAFGTGRGELLVPVRALPVREVLLLIPPFGVATGDAYRWLDESGRHTALDGVSPPSEGEWSWNVVERLAGDRGNDFENVVEVRHPELREYRRTLTGAGARIARLSGSGSSVFGIFEGGCPSRAELPTEALVVQTRTSERVVQVEVRE